MTDLCSLYILFIPNCCVSKTNQNCQNIFKADEDKEKLKV